jgi:hypothetical protein
MENIKFIEQSLISMYLSDYLKDLDVADPVKEVMGFTVFEFDKKIAIDEVLNNLSNNNELKQSIIKDGDNWKVRLFKDHEHVPLKVDGKFYVAYDNDLTPFDNNKYFESLEEAEKKINEIYNKNTIYCDIMYWHTSNIPDANGARDVFIDKINYNNEKYLDHHVRKDFVEFLKKNNIIIHNGWLVVDCRQKEDKIVYGKFSLSSGQLISGNFVDVSEVDIRDKCIVRNGRFNSMDVNDNIIVKNADANIISLGLSFGSDDVDNGPKIYNGNYKIGNIWVGEVYGGNFDTLICCDKFTKLYNCNINNFILNYLPEDFNKFKGTINNVIVLNNKLDLLKSSPKLIKMAKKIYLSDVDREDFSVPREFEEVLSNLKQIDKKDLKKKLNNKPQF